MLSHSIEIENIEKQLAELNKEINTIQNDIKESRDILRLKELRLEQKQNLKISLEKRMKELKENTHIYTDYMDSQGFDKRDQKYESNNQIINSNSDQINDLNNQINNSKNLLTKIDLKIERKKLQIYNNILNRKNIFLEQKQRVYLTFSRNVDKLENMPQKFLVSVNNVKVRNMKEKYENKIERTYELETHQNKLQEEGHKIRSKFFGKVVEFYTKSDNRTKDKYQKLLQTKSEFLKLESAKQFYDNYDLTRNQKRVLSGESLKHDDINEGIIQINGDNFLQDSEGNITYIPPEIFMREIEKVQNKEEKDSPKQNEEEVLVSSVPIENSIDVIKNVGRYGKIDIPKKNEGEELSNTVIQDPVVNETKDNIVYLQKQYTNDYIALIRENLAKNNINFVGFGNSISDLDASYTLNISGIMDMNEIQRQLSICTELGIKANVIVNGIEMNNFDSFENENIKERAM